MKNRWQSRTFPLAIVAVTVVGAFTVLTAAGSAPPPPESSRDILQRFASDYANDPSIAAPQVFGVRVGEERFTVRARPVTGGGPAEVTLSAGDPDVPAFVFVLDRATLEKLDLRQMNGLTAGARAFESESTPLDLDAVGGWKPGQDGMESALAVWFHFWTRGLPEVIPFAPELTRAMHGAQATVLYYQKGFRSAWVSLEPGQHVNDDARLETNPFPTLLVVLTGRGYGRVGGRELLLTGGEAVFIPPATAHEFWNPFSERMTAILLMFGDGA